MLSTLGAFGYALTTLALPTGQAVTVAFLSLALGQLWNVFNVRAGDTGLFANDIVRNPAVWGALVLCAALVAAVVAIAPLAAVLSLPNPGQAGLITAGVASLVPLVVGQVALMLRG